VRSIVKQHALSQDNNQADDIELVSSQVVVTKQQSKGFTENAICSQFNCVNPITPGLLDLATLADTSWQCQNHSSASKYLQFCKDAVFYDMGVPSPQSESTSLSEAVLAQDNAAATTYFYHLNGLQLDPWEHRQPSMSDDPCVRNIWKTVCATYFPRAEVGCKAGEYTQYLRPCKNVCENYLRACKVQCCDESVQCAFSKDVQLLNGSTTMLSGYASQSGPSAFCTGAAYGLSDGMQMLWLIAAIAVTCGLTTDYYYLVL